MKYTPNFFSFICKKNRIQIALLIIIVITNFLWYIKFLESQNDFKTRLLESVNSNVEIVGKDLNFVENVGELKEKVIFNGDLEAYAGLSIHFLDLPSDYFLFWSLLAANKYNSTQAHYNVYTSIGFFEYGNTHLDKYINYKRQNAINLDDLDEKTRKFALDYLEVAASRNHYNACVNLAVYYGLGKYYPQDTIKADSLLLRLKNMRCTASSETNTKK